VKNVGELFVFIDSKQTFFRDQKGRMYSQDGDCSVCDKPARRYRDADVGFATKQRHKCVLSHHFWRITLGMCIAISVVKAGATAGRQTH